MTEQNKQKNDPQEKPSKQQQANTKKKQADIKTPHAGSSTDATSVNDKQYVERIEEKTEKH